MKKFVKTLVMIMFLGVIACGCSNNASVHSLSVQKLNNKANQYMQQNKPERAIETLQAVIDLDPKYPETYYNLGVAYYQTGKYDKSVDSLLKAIKIKKDMAPAYYTLGIDYEEVASKFIEEKQDKGQIAETLSMAITAYSDYLKYNQQAEDKQQVQAKIDSLNNELKNYTTTN